MTEEERERLLQTLASQPVPPDVHNDFRIIANLGREGKLFFMAAVPAGASRIYYFVGFKDETGASIPLAVVPHRINAFEFARRMDLLIQQNAAVEVDPDFRGIKH
jgi:hypothetical protein